MPSDALLQALRHVWQTLQPLGVPAALTGGLAMAVWKHARATRDVDLLVGIRADDTREVCRALVAAGIRPRRTPPVVSLGRLQVLQLLYEPPETFMDLQVDLLFDDSEYSREALERRVWVRLPGLDLDIAVLSCEDLILHKLLAARAIDRADAVALLRANRESLDTTYLARWAERLEFSELLSQAWSESLPGEGGWPR